MKTIFNRLRSTAILVTMCCQVGSIASAQSLGDKIVSSLSNNLNIRMGGGESSHMAIEALRIGGAEFIASDLGSDSPSPGDSVWGWLVTVISSPNGSWSDSNPSNTAAPGDVIQFGSAVFGDTIYPPQFTAVVAAVDSNGRPSSIFQQNFGGERTVQQSDFDATQLTDGWMRIYRPNPRTDRFNEWKFTIVNNDYNQHTYYLMDSVDTITTVVLSATNTTNSFQVHCVRTDGTVPNFLLRNQSSYFVEVGKGNEIFRSANGLAVRQLSK